MASYALALSSPKPFFSPLKHSSFQCRILEISQSQLPKSCDQLSHKHVITSSFASRNINLRNLCSSRRLCEFKVRSAAVPDSRNEAGNTDKLIRTLQLGAMFVVWYLLNIYFNIFNKQVPFNSFFYLIFFSCLFFAL